MKITLKRDKFLNAIKAVKGIVAGRPVQPILSSILIECESENKVKLTTTDLNLAMSFTFEAEILKEGKVAISSKYIEEIVTKLPEGKEITLETDSETNVVKVQGGKTKYEIVSFKAEEFPDILNSKKLTENEVEPKTFEIETKELNQAIKQTAFSAVQTEMGGVLGGICFAIEENTLEMAATDGNRLTRSKLPINSKGESIVFICPYRSLTEVSRIISLASDKTVKFTVKGAKIIFEFEEILFQSGLMEGTYPKYQQLIPTANEKIAIIDREKFINSIDRISVMVNNRTNIMKFSFEKADVLTISADTLETGSAKEAIDIEYPAEDLLIAFNYKYVLDCIRNISCEKIKFEMSTNLSASVIKPYNDEGEAKENYLCLIMPVQVRQ